MKKKLLKNFIALLFLLAIAGIIVFSYYRSRMIYSFYQTVYYKHIKRFSAEDVKNTAESLLKKNKKDECVRFLNDMLSIFYDDAGIIKTAAHFYIKMDDKEKGTALFLAAVDKSPLTPSELNIIVPELLKAGYFGDIVSLLSSENLSGRMKNIYGIALYHTGRYNQAVGQLQSAIHENGGNSTLYYCLARSYENLNNAAAALAYMEKGYALEPKNKIIREALSKLYDKNHLYKKAADILPSN